MSKIPPAIDYTDIKSFISFLDDAGLKFLTRDELIRAYIGNLYGVTLDNFEEASITPPTKEEIEHYAPKLRGG